MYTTTIHSSCRRPHGQQPLRCICHEEGGYGASGHLPCLVQSGPQAVTTPMFDTQNIISHDNMYRACFSKDTSQNNKYGSQQHDHGFPAVLCCQKTQTFPRLPRHRLCQWCRFSCTFSCFCSRWLNSRLLALTRKLCMQLLHRASQSPVVQVCSHMVFWPEGQ